jgi:hypothetical protein
MLTKKEIHLLSTDSFLDKLEEEKQSFIHFKEFADLNLFLNKRKNNFYIISELSMDLEQEVL